MIIKIRMKNFRRFKDEKLEFGENISYIEGMNNSGKTTVFMAIEYALFGNITGFRSQSSLMNPKSNQMGVEIYYRGKKGGIYKLQRMHEMRSKSAKGHFTFKKVEEDGEKYILSSDFENNTEEMLQLQIFESLGISKRLFDVAINIRQGEITSILDGDKHLDIVLGVSAAVMAKKQLNKVALGFEKETSQYPTLEASLKGYQSERKELTNQEKHLGIEIEELQGKFEKYEKQLNEAQMSIDQLKPVSESYDTFKSLCHSWDRIFDKIKDQVQRIQKLQDTTGDLDKVKTTISEEKEEMKALRNQQKDVDNTKEELQQTLRKLEQQNGDLAGKINRRKNLPEGEATCEECGAVIDQERVKSELKQWIQEKDEISETITKTEEKIQQQNKELQEIHNNLQSLTRELSTSENILKQLKEAEKEKVTLLVRLEEKNDEMLDQVVDLYDKLQEYNEIQQDREKISISKPELLDLNTPIELAEDVIMARSMESVYAQKLSTTSTHLEEKFREIEVELRVIKGQLEDKEKQKQNLKPRIHAVNKEMAEIEQGMKLLSKKRNAAEKMRLSAKIFGNLQTELRDHAAGNLGKETLALHELLAETKQYDALSVDPKNYKIYVKPHDIGEEVPASSHQGGGHKLLLGIAFKLAIIKLVTKAPFILLDEPTYGLDTSNRSKLFEKIGKVTNSQLMLITHQREDEKVDGKLFKVVKDDVNSIVEELQ